MKLQNKYGVLAEKYCMRINAILQIILAYLTQLIITAADLK